MPEPDLIVAQSAPEKPYQQCDGRGIICPTLSKRLQDGHHSKGLNSLFMVNVETGKELPALLAYKCAANDKGIVLNFCPFCGVSLNLEYRTPPMCGCGRAFSHRGMCSARQQAFLMRTGNKYSPRGSSAPAPTHGGTDAE